jgi:hypothetical protein
MFFLVEYDILMVLHTHLGQRAHLANWILKNYIFYFTVGRCSPYFYGNISNARGQSSWRKPRQHHLKSFRNVCM